MKSIIAFALIIAAAVAVPVDPAREATGEIEFDNIGVNGYTYRYRTSDGKSASEEAILKNVGSENEAIEVRGSFTYPGPDGVIYTVNYISNENGFQPQGSHLPQ